MKLTIHAVAKSDVHIYRMVRLCALQDTPGAFGSTYERERQFSDEDWISRTTRMTGPGAAGFIARADNEACGLVAILRDEQHPNVGTLVSMWVAAPFRRLGVGRMLVRAALDWARDHAVWQVSLMVTRSNHAAIRFYRRLGFALGGRTDIHPDDPRIEELEMTLAVDRSPAVPS